MGANADYLGHVRITPNLNQAEYDYLRAFSASRRSRRREGPYCVEPPRLYGARKRRGEDENELAAGQPSFWCHWEPCPHGCCLSWNGFERFYAGDDWLRYLIDHFLRPGAHAERSGDPQFTDFTFDHEVNGFIVGEHKDVRELFALIAHEGQVERVVLRDGDPAYGEEGHLRVEDRPWLARDDDPWRPPEPFDLPFDLPSDLRAVRRRRNRRGPSGVD